MIIGLGLDLVEVERVRGALARHGGRFLERLLTPRERAAVHGERAAYVAARLAGKEAAFKALGTGWAQGVTWKQVEILNAPSGRPYLTCAGRAGELLAQRNARAQVTLTHSRQTAAAVVVLEACGEAGPGTQREE